MSAILSLEPNQNYAGMLGLLVQFCTTHKELDVVNQHKAGGLAEGEEGGFLLPWAPRLWLHLTLVDFLIRGPGLFPLLMKLEELESFPSNSVLGRILAVVGMVICLWVQ